jgi:hypothetical protein
VLSVEALTGDVEGPSPPAIAPGHPDRRGTGRRSARGGLTSRTAPSLRSRSVWRSVIPAWSTSGERRRLGAPVSRNRAPASAPATPRHRVYLARHLPQHRPGICPGNAPSICPGNARHGSQNGSRVWTATWPAAWRKARMATWPPRVARAAKRFGGASATTPNAITEIARLVVRDMPRSSPASASTSAAWPTLCSDPPRSPEPSPRRRSLERRGGGLDRRSGEGNTSAAAPLLDAPLGKHLQEVLRHRLPLRGGSRLDLPMDALRHLYHEARQLVGVGRRLGGPGRLDLLRGHRRPFVARVVCVRQPTVTACFCASSCIDCIFVP